MDSRALDDIQEFGDIAIFSLDFDNCLKNKNLIISDEIEAFYINNPNEFKLLAEKLLPDMLAANRPLLDTLKAISQQYEKTHVVIFSNRQSKLSEQANVPFSCYFTMPGIIEDLNKVAKPNTDFVPLLLADIYNGKAPGTAYNLAVADPDYQRPDEHPHWRFDETKVTVRFSMEWEFAKRYPGKKIDNYIVDDNSIILNALSVFHHHYPMLSPANVRTRLFQYEGEEAKLTAELSGTGLPMVNRYEDMLIKMGILAATPDADGYNNIMHVGTMLAPENVEKRYPGHDLLTLLNLNFKTEQELQSALCSGKELLDTKTVDEFMGYMQGLHNIQADKGWYRFGPDVIRENYGFTMGYKDGKLFMHDKLLSKFQSGAFAKKVDGQWVPISAQEALTHSDNLFRKAIEYYQNTLAKSVEQAKLSQVSQASLFTKKPRPPMPTPEANPNPNLNQKKF